MKPLQILLLEDSLLDMELIEANLAQGNLEYQLVRVATRDQFLQALTDCAFDVILADYSLPQFDGISALEVARTRCQEVPFIFLSGTLGEELAVDLLKSGATDYVLKQRLQRLVPAIERALREREQRAERQRMQQELHRRDQEFRALVENSPDIIFRLDRQLCHVYVSPAIAALGHTPEELIGKTHTEIPLLAGHAQLWQRNLQLIFSSAQERTLEVDLRARDGTHKLYQARMVPELAQDGSVEFVLAVARDITESRELLRREQAARAEAEAANRVKDEFLAVLSHELRTPLNSILGWASLLKTRQYSQSRLQQAIEVIERNARLQTQLIDDLLDVSRILRGKLSLNMNPVDLACPLQATVDSMRLAAQAKSIQVQLAVAPGVGRVLGDANRLQQVFWNLLSNAIKFTPPKGHIEIRLSVVGSQAQVQVSDTGKGIDPQFLPHIFEYFCQEDGSTTRKSGGLGLGLAIARHLIEMHGGTIEAHSPGVGKGATFTVRLPLMNAPSPTSAANGSAPCSPSLQGLRVLVVDDEADTRELIPLILKQEGAQAIAVASASEALAQFPSFAPDVLISDIGMPEVDGYALLRQIRSLPGDRGGSVGAIALTAYARDEDAQAAIAAGFHKHLPKPVNPDRLVNAVLELVQSSAQTSGRSTADPRASVHSHPSA